MTCFEMLNTICLALYIIIVSTYYKQYCLRFIFVVNNNFYSYYYSKLIFLSLISSYINSIKILNQYSYKLFLLIVILNM